MQLTATIANGATASNAMLIQGDSGVFQIPAAITGASIQPKMSIDGTNWTSVGSALSVSANGTYAIPAACFTAPYLQLVSASAEGAARSILVFTKHTGQTTGVSPA